MSVPTGGREGSSPRVRGKLPGGLRRGRRRRLIPACAGKTSPPSARWAKPRAHPRVCGENTSSHAVPSEVAGSSPRVRGKHHPRAPRHRRPRLIPACAGKTVRVLAVRSAAEAHPRVCGENLLLLSRIARPAGSSPRVRGKQSGGVLSHGGLRLIPACAGKTPMSPLSRRTARAHPRVCGENWAGLRPTILLMGSSPRVRGKHAGRPPNHPGQRLIPACAGKTLPRSRTYSTSGAHPRVCGENRAFDVLAVGRMGSSPRVRGKRHRFHGVGLAFRLIPARAGKTART